VDDVLLNSGIGLLSLHPEDMETVISSSKKFSLDFDDAYQYTVANRYDLELVSFDTDFRRTDNKNKTPSEILEMIS
jgi:predicted nucleic acid-binding protein